MLQLLLLYGTPVVGVKNSTEVMGQCDTVYRVTHHVVQPPIDLKTQVPLWHGQARLDQNRTFVLKSTGGFG